MIRVMVVEDEPPIMRVIIKFIESFGEEFKVVATAINGKKALEVLEKEEIDVVFTDIKMPVMDGLKLTEHIKEQMPEIVVVIISGFQDFQYARKALQFQVCDYLLKPISQEAITTVLEKISKDLIIKSEAKQRQQIIHFMNESRTEKPNKEAESDYAIFLICIGSFPLVPNDSMLPARDFWDRVIMDEKLSKVLAKEENSMCFNGKSAAEMVVVAELKTQERIIEVADKLMEQLKTNNALPITLVSSQNLIKLSHIGKVLKTLRTKLYVNTQLFTSQILWLEKEEMQSKNRLDTKMIIETIHSAIDSSELTNSIVTALTKFSDSGFTQLQILTFLDNIINGQYFKNNIFNKDTSALKMDLEIAVSNAIDEKSLAKEIAFIMVGASHQEEKTNEKGSTPDIAQKIEEYLKSHYQESITTNMLSKKFGFVPSYISKLFRTYKGMSPSEYLTYYRIEKSKQIMLKEPEVLCKEVANMVGFSDQHHFSKTFKKQTGMSPTEYATKKQ
jgi:YesN/AraC family two-component response regulator